MCVCACMHVYMCRCIMIYIYIYICIYLLIYLFIHLFVYLFIYVYTSIYIYISISYNIYIYTYAEPSKQGFVAGRIVFQLFQPNLKFPVWHQEVFRTHLNYTFGSGSDCTCGRQGPHIFHLKEPGRPAFSAMAAQAVRKPFLPAPVERQTMHHCQIRRSQ